MKSKQTYIMIKNNFTYLTPECTVFNVSAEGVLCSSPDNIGDSFIEDFEKLPGSWD